MNALLEAFAPLLGAIAGFSFVFLLLYAIVIGA